MASLLITVTIAANILLAVLGTIGNGVMILAFIRRREIRTLSNYFNLVTLHQRDRDFGSCVSLAGFRRLPDHPEESRVSPGGVLHNGMRYRLHAELAGPDCGEVCLDLLPPNSANHPDPKAS